MQLSHNHLKFVGYQQAQFVESATASTVEQVRQRNRDHNKHALLLLLEREFLPSYSSAETAIANNAVKKFLQVKGREVTAQAAGELKRTLLRRVASSPDDTTAGAACDYLATISREHCVKYAIHDTANSPTYDEVTSNLSESANNWIGNTCRSSSPVLALRSKCTLVPSIDGVYEVEYNDSKPKRNGYLHPWRAVNLEEQTCTYKNWHDMQFPCIHSVQAAVRHGVHVYDLFKLDNYTVSAFRSTYNYAFVPVTTNSTYRVDLSLRVPDVMLADIRIGKRGLCLGKKPKHKRKTACVGSAASPHVAMQ